MNTIVLPDPEPHSTRYISKDGHTLCMLHVQNTAAGVIVTVAMHGTAPVHVHAPGIMADEVGAVNSMLTSMDARVVIVTDEK